MQFGSRKSLKWGLNIIKGTSLHFGKYGAFIYSVSKCKVRWFITLSLSVFSSYPPEQKQISSFSKRLKYCFKTPAVSEHHCVLSVKRNFVLFKKPDRKPRQLHHRQPRAFLLFNTFLYTQVQPYAWCIYKSKARTVKSVIMQEVFLPHQT